MTTSLVPFEVPKALLTELIGLFPEQSNKDLTEGVQPSFGVVTFRGKVWRVRHKGEDMVIKHPETGDPVSSIIAVIVKSSPAISKLYYSKNYTEGDDAPPLCYSLDGVAPDPTAAEQQSPTCAACPHNVWGSKVITGDDGKQRRAKACADNRRLAIVPYPDLKNERFGGPMLLRVPPTSLVELARLGDALKQSGLPYQAVVVKISFDYDVAYPKLVFSALRPLTTAEASVVIEHMNSDTVLRMLMEPVQGDETGAADTPPEPQREPERAPVTPEPRRRGRPPKSESAAAEEPAEPTPEPVEAEARKTPAKAATAPASTVSADLNSMISGLLGE